jgi:hypothetical protein
MSPQTIFLMHLVLGYVAWLLCFGAYILPRLRSMDRFGVQRAIATLHSFRFFGLVFILPGVIGPNLPDGFGSFAAYGDLATGSAGHPGASHGEDSPTLFGLAGRAVDFDMQVTTCRLSTGLLNSGNRFSMLIFMIGGLYCAHGKRHRNLGSRLV